MTDLQERDFAPNVGGGVDRDKLKSTDFVMPGERKFPVVKPGDVSDAVSAFGRSKGVDFETFKRNMIALCKRKGKAFMAALPQEWKDEMNMESAPQRASVLVEAIDLSEASLDTENRTLKDVILIRSGRSANKRQYDEAVLQSAVAVFEGSKAFANHPNRKNVAEDRNIRDLTGWYSNVRYENGVLKADRHFLNTQAGQDVYAIASAVVEGKAPKTLAGLSINAVGNGKMEKDNDGEFLRVESITAANSVDDVSSPAAGGAYTLAASAGDALMDAWIESLPYQQWFDSFPAHVERHKKEVQTIRLDEETKRALSEADLRVKAEHDARVNAEQSLQEAQGQVTRLEEKRVLLLEDLNVARQELALEKALKTVKLPNTYLEDLRKRLPGLPMQEWVNTIEIEISKAKRVSSVPKVAVNGAGYQESVPIVARESMSLEPLDGENTADWQERLKRNGVLRG